MLAGSFLYLLRIGKPQKISSHPGRPPFMSDDIGKNKDIYTIRRPGKKYRAGWYGALAGSFLSFLISHKPHAISIQPGKPL